MVAYRTLDYTKAKKVYLQLYTIMFFRRILFFSFFFVLPFKYDIYVQEKNPLNMRYINQKWSFTPLFGLLFDRQPYGNVLAYFSDAILNEWSSSVRWHKIFYLRPFVREILISSLSMQSYGSFFALYSKNISLKNENFFQVCLLHSIT